MLIRRLAILSLVALGLQLMPNAPQALAQQDRIATAKRETRQFDDLRSAGKLDEAEKYIQGLIERYRRVGDSQFQWFFTYHLADLYLQQDRSPEALPLAEAAAPGCIEHWGPKHPIAGSALTLLGRVYSDLLRLDESLALYQRARGIAVAKNGPNSKQVIDIDGFISSDLAHLGRYQEAERLRLRTLAWERQQSKGRATAGIGVELHNLANLYYKQARHKDAKASLLEACEVYQQAGLANSLYSAKALNLLGDVHQAMNRYAEAVDYFQQSHELFVQLLGPEHPLAAIQGELADCYSFLGKHAEAAAIFEQSLKSAEAYYGAASTQVYDIKHSMLTLYFLQEKYEMAEQLSSELVTYADRPQVPRPVLASAFSIRALAARCLNKLDDACLYDARAVELSEEELATLSGGEQQRAESMSAGYYRYSCAAIDHLRTKKIAEGFAFSERGRGRTLIDQMALGHVDLYAGMPAEQARRLRAGYDKLQNQTTDLERRVRAVADQSDLSAEEKREQLGLLGAQLQASRKEQAEAYSYIRNESPALRRITGRNFTGVSLADMQSYLKREEALLLYYVVAPDEIALMVCDGDEQVGLFRLTPPDLDESKEFGTKVVAELLVNADQTGAVQLLADPTSEQALIPKLSALAKLLIPDAVQAALREKQYRRLLIVPDGPLSMLPFEALVLDEAPETEYLLDIAPPISYTLSATILMNLQERPAVEIPADRDPVLALGDPAYGESDGAQSERVAALDTTFRRRGGQLSRLPYSGLEATWVAETFKKHGMKAGVLRDRSATEAAVRAHAPNRRIVHLACHGLADDEMGNFFGALALAPGRAAKSNPRDDGFLTLTELYELDLQACELAILSACQTNYGPQHGGEGIWALSRSFLVAGSRRVVASNWLVDDKAGASLISYFCGALVKQPENETDYAQALMEAKRWTRGQTQWGHPYYWATFVLIGPR
jgi:CHAT domain-containing protein